MSSLASTPFLHHHAVAASSSPASSTSSAWTDDHSHPAMTVAAPPPPPPPPATADHDDSQYAGLQPGLALNNHSGGLSPRAAAASDSHSSDGGDSRRSSVYLPMDSQPPTSTAQDWTWTLSKQHLAAGFHEEVPVAKSPSQINPHYGLPPSTGKLIESYQDVQDYSYTKYDNFKASPPTRNSSSFDEKRGGHKGSDPSKQVIASSMSKGTRPFYRSVSQQVNLASLRSTPSTTPRSGGSRESMGLYNVPPKSVLRQRLDSSAAWLLYYFAFNLGLTIYNKRVLQGFPFPWTLTGIHTLCGAIGSQVALNYRFFSPSRLSRRENFILIAFSVLYTVNIAVSNLSLHLVTVPFHQVVRATTPLFTISLSILWFHKSYSSKTYLALFIVVAGVGFSTFGDYGWTSWGLFLTLLGTLLAACKTVVTNVIQVGRLKLHPLELLLRMSPLAFIQCVTFSWWSGEMSRVREYGATQMTKEKGIALFFNGVIAFGLNVVSFTANKKTSALTMTVAANVKQVLTIVLAVFVFDLVITPTNFLGISLTLMGGALYAKIELDQKKLKKSVVTTSTTNHLHHLHHQHGHSNSSNSLTNIIAEGEKRIKE